MRNKGWITHKVPTKTDATFDPCRYENGELYGVVWVSSGGISKFCDWEVVKPGQPWQPVQRPEPYVNTERFVVMYTEHCNTWVVIDRHTVELELPNRFNCREAAERIAAIYNEVMQ